MVDKEILKLKKENEDLKKKVEEQENPFKGFYIVIRPGYPGLSIGNAAGLNIKKGTFQSHPPYPVDQHIFKVLKSREAAVNYVKNVYPPDIVIKPSRVTSKKTRGLGTKPSFEEMRQGATQLDVTNIQEAEDAKRKAETIEKEKEKILTAEEKPKEKVEEKGRRKEKKSEFTEADAKNLLNQNSITVGKCLKEQFKDGISPEDKVTLLVAEKIKVKKRKRVIQMIESLKVI